MTFTLKSATVVAAILVGIVASIIAGLMLLANYEIRYLGCLSVPAGLASGALAIWLARRQRSSTNAVARNAVVGTVAGALGAAVVSIVQIAYLVVGGIGLAQHGDPAGLLVIGVLGGLYTGCLALIIGGVMGAIGGVVCGILSRSGSVLDHTRTQES
jgi:hypothetical protein